MKNNSQNICLIAHKHPNHSASIVWVAAALFSKYLPHLSLNLHLVEIDDKSVPEINLSPMQPNFFGVLQQLDIDEITLLAKTGANFNLGFVYHNLGLPQTLHNKVCNVFGDYAANLASISQSQEQMENFNLAAKLALNNKFCHPDDNFKSILSSIDYGWMLNHHSYFELLKQKTLNTSAWTNIKITTANVIAEQDHQMQIDFRPNQTQQQSNDQTLSLVLPLENLPNILNDFLPSAQHAFATELGLIQLQADQQHLVFKLNTQPQSVSQPVFKNRLKSIATNHLCLNKEQAQALAQQIQQAQVKTHPVANWHTAPEWKNGTIQFSNCDASCNFISQLELLHIQLQQLFTLWPNNLSSNNNASLMHYFNQEVSQENYDNVVEFETAHQLFSQPFDQPIDNELQSKLEQYQQAGQVFCHQSNPNQQISETAWLNLFRALNIPTNGMQQRFTQTNAKQLNLLQLAQQHIKQCVAQQLSISDYINRYQVANQ